MFDTIRDFLAFAYKATDAMEEKAGKIRDERRHQAEAFREKVAEAKDEMGERINEKRDNIQEKIRTQVREAVKDAGVATKDDLAELMSRLSALNDKVDKLAK